LIEIFNYVVKKKSILSKGIYKSKISKTLNGIEISPIIHPLFKNI